MDQTSLGRQALIGACLGVALSARAGQSPDDFAHDRDPTYLIPLARALQAAMFAGPQHVRDDPFASVISVHIAWIHVRTDQHDSTDSADPR